MTTPTTTTTVTPKSIQATIITTTQSLRKLSDLVKEAEFNPPKRGPLPKTVTQEKIKKFLDVPTPTPTTKKPLRIDSTQKLKMKDTSDPKKIV
jgi:hypothetical protein